jgi:DNA-binding transcriptional LysR family regulator
VHGTLRIAAPYEFGAHHLASVACTLMTAYPQLKVHVDVEHARVALFERNYDIVFSSIEPSQAPSSTVTRRVYSLERGLFAAPALLADLPSAADPEDLHAFPLLAGADDQAWAFTNAEGANAEIEVRNPRMRSGNAELRLRCAVAGLGIARITSTFCAAAVARGELVPVLAGWRCEPLWIYALLPGRRLVPAKVREFLARLEDEANGALSATR